MATREIYIIVTIVFLALALVGFYVVSQRSPKGTVLAIAGMLFFAGASIPQNQIRELMLAEGLLRMTGVIGGILGIIDLFRKSEQPNEIIDAEIIPTATTGDEAEH